MSVESVMARVAELHSALGPRIPVAQQTAAPTAVNATQFATMLNTAQFRAATDGAPGPGPWCAYFTSWAAKEAGVPLGNNGQGFGRVDDVYAWAQSAGKANPISSGQPPQPGDLIVWDEHIGIVESVGP